MTQQGIAIIAYGQSAAETPWDDPTWERWTLHDAFVVLPERFHVEKFTAGLLFELHSPEEIKLHAYSRIEDYVERMATMPIPIMVSDRRWRRLWPTAQMLPVKDLVARGRDYFTCTVAYMVALAVDRIAKGLNAPRIAMYGCDAEIGTEWAYEQPCIVWWLGLAQGMGIKVTIAKGSALLRHPRRYALDHGTTPREVIRVQQRIASLQKKVDELAGQERARHDEKIFCDGAISEAMHWARQVDYEFRIR